MSHRPLVSASLAAATTLTALAYAPPANAAAAHRTVKVKSFDGVSIVTHFFRAPGLKKGERRPTVMLAHGWGGRGETDTRAGQLGPLLKAGYNVVTWNARGFGSPGAANVDDPRVEGRDVRRLIDWVARQKEVRLDRKGDPRIGMAGPSYGGAIQLIAAGLDRRVDVIAPMVTFSDLSRSLYPDRTFRAGWGILLCTGGVSGGNKVSWQVQAACASGMASGELPAHIEKWFDDHGPAHLVRRIKVPTLVLQGTVDTLFTLRQGIQTYRTVKANGAPVKMVWFCGGHGVCKTPAGAADHTMRATLAWFGRYLRKDKSVKTGAEFEYIDQKGVYRTAPSYPMPELEPLRAQGSGSFAFSRDDAEPFLDQKQDKSKGGLPFPPYIMAAEPAAKAVNVPIPAPSGDVQTVGTPRVTLHYKGSAKRQKTSFFAQIVDRSTGLVVGNQATPIPVVLDGKDRTVTRELEAVAWSLAAGSRLELQITPITGLFDWQRSAGSVELTAKVSLPAVRPGAAL